MDPEQRAVEEVDVGPHETHGTGRCSIQRSTGSPWNAALPKNETVGHDLKYVYALKGVQGEFICDSRVRSQ